MTLFQIQVPIVLLSGVFALLIGFAFQQIAANVEDPSVSGLAMMCAWMYFVTAFLFLATGPLGILHLVTILRKERRD